MHEQESDCDAVGCAQVTNERCDAARAVGHIPMLMIKENMERQLEWCDEARATIKSPARSRQRGRIRQNLFLKKSETSQSMAVTEAARSTPGPPPLRGST